MPRMASLLLDAGRLREAAALVRRHPEPFTQSTDGLLVKAELAQREGDETAATALWEELCHRLPGIHAAWLHLLHTTGDDSVRHLEVLRSAWELDQFSPRLNNEMDKSGLRRTADYEQALRPTAVEAARREEQFRRLLDRHAHGAVTPATEETSSPSLDLADTLAREGETPDSASALAGECAPLPDAGLEPPVVDSIPAADAELSPFQLLQVEEPRLASAEGDPLQDADEEGEVSGPEPPPSPQRDRQLQEQAERLSSLTRPLRLSSESTPRKSPRDADLFDPRSMMTRRLAAIYLQQGYPALAVRTLEVLSKREPDAMDLEALLSQAREAERRLAESAPSPSRRKR